MLALKIVGLVVASYLVGNVSFSRIIAKLCFKDDITKHGSGNPGMTNMLRTHGILPAIITLILDGLKGVISAVCGFFLLGGYNDLYFANIGLYVGGLAAVIGHIYPVFYKFKGGKGIATAAGVCIVAHPIMICILLVVYVIGLLLTKIGSLSALCMALTYIIMESVILCMAGNYWAFGCLFMIFALIVFAHRSNIKRLIEKRESKIYVSESFKKDIQHIQNFKNRKKQVENTDNEIKKQDIAQKEKINEIKNNKETK